MYERYYFWICFSAKCKVVSKRECWKLRVLVGDFRSGWEQNINGKFWWGQNAKDTLELNGREVVGLEKQEDEAHIKVEEIEAGGIEGQETKAEQWIGLKCAFGWATYG